MKNKMIFSLIFTIANAITLSAHAQAPGSTVTSDDLNQIYTQINEAETASDNLINSLRVTINVKNIRFPDYPQAHEQFMNESEVSLSGLKKAFSEIRQEISIKLSDSLSRLASLQKYAKEQPSKANAELLKIEEDAFQKEIVAISNSINQKYTQALKNIFSLSGRLVFSMGRKDNFFQKSSSAAVDGQVTAIFSGCTTGGCTLNIAGEYAQWLKMVEPLNHDILLTNGLKLNAISVVESKKAEERLSELAIYRCRKWNLPPGLLSP
jgi:DNA-directed RNA polymerase subunit F